MTAIVLTEAPKGNVTIMGEQDFDHKPWGGACSKLPAVAAMYACVGGPAYYRKMAEIALNWMTYFVDVDGCPTALNNGLNLPPSVAANLLP